MLRVSPSTSLKTKRFLCVSRDVMRYLLKHLAPVFMFHLGGGENVCDPSVPMFMHLIY